MYMLRAKGYYTLFVLYHLFWLSWFDALIIVFSERPQERQIRIILLFDQEKYEEQ